MQTVPRHVFVPDASLEEAYADSTVDIKQNSDGTSISCASQPSVVGLMLEQLQPQPGDKVLELGAGTGYNAGLLAHLVGEGGHVTTIDVDDDLVDGAVSQAPNPTGSLCGISTRSCRSPTPGDQRGPRRVHTDTVTCRQFWNPTRLNCSLSVGGALANPSPGGVPSGRRVQLFGERRA
jgi:hypothetical protein